MEQRQVDVVPLRPFNDLAFGLMQREDRGGRAGVLRGIRIAQHDLHLAAGGLEASLHLRDLDDLVKHVYRVLQILQLFEQRDDVDGRHVLRVRERQAVELVHVAHVLRRLGERDDVPSGGLQAVALLDGAQGAEGVEHFLRHRLQRAALAVQTVLPDVLQGTRMHHGMLAELHLHHVEAEGFGLPDQILQRAVGRTWVAGGQGALHDLQIGQEILAAVVHQIRVARDGVMQAIGHDQHDRAVRLLGGELVGVLGEPLAHLLLTAPQQTKLLTGGRGLGIHRQILADGAGGVLQRGDHMVAEVAGHLTAHLGGDVRVAVAVRTDPAARVEERGARRRHQTRLIAQQPVVETAVHLGNRVE